ncbi:MAG: hypothetical protein AAF551_12630 [Bacteroidota bacterium]
MGRQQGDPGNVIKMNEQVTISILWASLVLGLLIHTAIDIVDGLYFSVGETSGEKPGAISTTAHVVYLSSMVVPFFMSFLSLKTSSKGFKTFSLVYASLLALLNIIHFVEGSITDFTNVSRIVVLLSIVVANLFLILELNRWENAS